MVYELLTQYEARIRELETGFEQARLHGTLAAVALAIAFALFLILGLLAVRRQVSFLWPPLPIPFAAVSASRFRRFRQSQSRMGRLRRFYGRAVERVQGSWAGNGASGEEFSDPAHVYARDLTVFGEGSLFELVARPEPRLAGAGWWNIY